MRLTTPPLISILLLSGVLAACCSASVRWKQAARTPLSAAQVAARFKRLKPEKVEPLLATLAALSLIRLTPEGAYAS
jgi:hypothetical protein